MKWFAQVGHVVAKDVRHLGWLVALSLLATAGATLRALDVVGAPDPDPMRFAWMGVLGGFMGPSSVVGVAAILVILLLQSDSSARSDAFWVTRPIAPSALLGAKVALAAALGLVLPLGAQVVALVTHHVPAERLLPMAAESLVLPAGILATAAVFAALTPDLRTFLAAFLVTAVAWAFSLRVVGFALLERGFRWPAPLGTLLPSAFLAVGGLLLVAFQYRQRDVRRTLRVFALPALVAMALMALPAMSGPSPYDGPEAPDRLRSGRLTASMFGLEVDNRIGLAAWQAFLELHLDGADAEHRYALQDGSVSFRLPDGSTVEHAFRRFGDTEVLLSEGEIRVPGFTNLHPERESVRPRSSSTWVPVSEPLAKALRAGGVTMTVRGSVVVRAPREVGRLPVRSGATLERDGSTYTVDRLASGSEGPGVMTSHTRVRSRAAQMRGSLEGARDVLALHAPRGEALRLVSRGSGGGGGHGLVLPGPTVTVERTTLRSPVPLERIRTAPDWDAFLREAELGVFEWEAVGRYPLSVELPAVLRDR